MKKRELIIESAGRRSIQATNAHLPMQELVVHTRSTCTESSQIELPLDRVVAFFIRIFFLISYSLVVVIVRRSMTSPDDLTLNVTLSYGCPLSLPSIVDKRAPRWQASHPGTAKSRRTVSNVGYRASDFLNPGRHTEEATVSLIPSSFRLAMCKGTAKYSSATIHQCPTIHSRLKTHFWTLPP